MKTYPCMRCGGEGRILTWSMVKNGVCFDCNGKGIVGVEVRSAQTWKLAKQRLESGREAMAHAAAR